jgi:hypothetical protein
MPYPLTPFFKQINSGEKVILQKTQSFSNSNPVFFFQKKETNFIWLLPLQTFHASLSKSAETKIV